MKRRKSRKKKMRWRERTMYCNVRATCPELRPRGGKEGNEGKKQKVRGEGKC